MKVLSRDFNTAERILLLVLVLVLLGLAYYQFVWSYAHDEITEAHAARDAMEIELQGVDAKVATYRAMQAELDTIDGADVVYSRMESYNNLRGEVDLLNEILSAADQYTMNISDVTRDGDQIRRNCSLSFSAKSFSTVQNIITELARSQYRCVINSIQYTGAQNTGDSISVSVNATFFETMVGGTPDAGLPAES